MTDNMPQPGDRYLHFKGTIYTVICVAITKAEKLVIYSKNADIPLPLVACHTETNEELIVFQGGETARAASFNQTDDIWARPVESFTEVFDKGTTSYPRFHRLSD